MSQYFIDKLVYNNDTLDIHDTEAREMINTNTTNIQAVSARVTKNANDINTLKDTTSVIREDLDNVEDRVSVTEAEIDGLNTRTTSLEGKMVTVENRLDGHDTKISGLESRMDTAENNITALDGRMTTAENDIDAAEHRLDLVEAKNNEQDIDIDTLEANVAKNTADIVDIKDDLTGIHKDIGDLDDRITASTYEAGIGIYFGQGVEHTNINVEDEILNQINQNTIDIQNLKTRVTNVENRLTVVEGDITNIKGDITDIKAEIVNIKADITALTVRVTALEHKVLPAGGTAGQVLAKVDGTDYNTEWIDAPSSGDIETYTLDTFDETLIPATAPFSWFIAGGDKNTASASYTSFMPLLENRESRGSYIYPACYLFRKIEGGSIYAVFTNPHFTTTFERVHINSVYEWTCSSPMPGGAFMFTMSDSTPTLTFVTFTYTNNLYGVYDIETLLTNNADKIVNAHFEANIIFGTDIHAERSMRVPITLSPDGDVFTFIYNSGGTVYRIICKRTGTFTWTATASAL